MKPAQAVTSSLSLPGRYRVIEVINRGPLADVYRVVDERLQRDVLFHILAADSAADETARTAFLTRIREYAQYSHPALLDVFDSGELDGRPYMVSEYLPERALYGRGMLPVGQAIRAISQVAEAVFACQERGIPPPPISSRNVWYIHERQVKLVDNWFLSADEALVDQACYRAPELAPGAPPTPASLVYALGLLLYEFLTGIRPATGDGLEAIALAHRQLRIVPLAQVRPTLYLPSLERLITGATAFAPEERWSGIQGFIDELERMKRQVESSTRRLPVALAVRHQLRVQQEQTGIAPAPSPVETSGSADAAQALIALSGEGKEVVAPDPLPGVVDPDRLVHRPLLQRVVGWLVTLLLLLAIAYGSYVLAGYTVDRIFAIKLPMPRWPEIGGVFEWWPKPSPAPALRVNIVEGLNLRDQPGTSSTVIATIRHGAKVYQLGKPQVVDNIEWVRVRASVGDVQDGHFASGEKTIEGWMSRTFLAPETP